MRKGIYLLFGVSLVSMSYVALGATVKVDDHFDDGVIGTNTTGVGTGFTTWTGNSGAIAESVSSASLETSVNGGDRAMIASIEGGAIESDISRFEFRGVSFAVGNTNGGTTARNALGVQGDGTAYNFDDGMKTGFWIQLENNSLATADGQGVWSGTSALIYEAGDNSKTVLATWEFDTLNWDSGTQDFTPVLDITLYLGPESYLLTIEGDTISNVTGSLFNTYAAAGITNELTIGYAFVFVQSENPGINITVDQIVITEDVPGLFGGPNDPQVTPEWEDNSVGTLQPNNEDVKVMLHFKAAGDPNTLRQPPLPVNPDVLGHYIYLSNGVATDDPNVYLLDYVEQLSETDPNISYGEITLKEGTDYYWQVEEAMDDGTGTPLGAGDPNNLLGSVWSFTTISKKPKILVDPENALADFSGNASFSVTAGPSPVVTDYRWFKVGDPDTELGDGGIYSNTQTATLTIMGAAVGDEGQFYCIVYNGDPDTTGIPSDPSSAARLWYPRLTSRYQFEAIVEPNTIVDEVDGFDMTLLSDDGGADLPVLAAGVPELAPNTSALLFDNSNSEDPAHWAQYALAEVGVADYKDITISVWVNWGGGANWQRILDFGNNTNEYIFLTPMAEGGGLRFAVNNAGEQSIDTGVPLPIGEWTYVTAALSADTARLYVNGQLEATGTITHDPVDFSPTLNYVGKSQWPDPYFNGLLDDLKIYNYARTTEQIAQDYLDVRGDWVCNNELNDLQYDLDGDCRIGLGDLAMLIVEEWMDSYRIYPVE